MSRKIYYIGIGWDPLVNQIWPSSIDKILDPIGDWMRLNDKTWFCSTSFSSVERYELIHERLPQLNSILIIALDPTSASVWHPNGSGNGSMANSETRRSVRPGFSREGIPALR